ncbi:uncharacterized protein LOC128675144 [Plodia interpunctella]|uniref:uncharacterized protein LOC128675144 n=1 Tax=Plodia interpunctella TaxID=58824 RepID=UPI0023688C3A|nr:uncharacterized protein LOC128675144 [Plodia interpunctella]
MHLIILVTLAATAAAMPSFIAVPADQIAFVDLSQLSVRRVPRQTLQPPPPPAPLSNLYSQDYQPIPLQYHQPIALAPHQQQENQPRLRVQPQVHQDVSGAASFGADSLAERPPDFGEYVDFGAHTGDHGAFGWYADYPINNHDDHHGYRK